MFLCIYTKTQALWDIDIPSQPTSEGSGLPLPPTDVDRGRGLELTLTWISGHGPLPLTILP